MDDNGEKMMLNEQKELLGRVITLETKVHQQEDEIVCLKSALSDVIRRLQTVETGKGQQNTLLPNKPTVRTATARTNANSQGSTRGNSAPIRKAVAPVESVATPHKSAPKSKPAVANSVPVSPLKKWPSLTASPNDLTNADIALSGQSEATPLADEPSVRLVLRGRGVGLYAPSDLSNYQPNQPGSLPTEKLKLEWVYGYRGKDARCNLYVLASGEIVYFIAATVILYHVDLQTQRFYLEHNDDVKSLAIHPDKVTIATGQVASHDKKQGKPHVRIWDSATLNTLRVVGLGDMDRAVSCLSFSKVDNGHYLLAIDESNEHIMSVWDWQKGDKGHKVAETKTSGDQVLCAEFSAQEKMQMVTCGKSHIAFWNMENGVLVKKLGLFEKQEKPKFVTSLIFNDNGEVVSGDSNGNLFVWSKGSNKIAKAITGLHEGGIGCVYSQGDGHFLTGGKDRKVVQWDTNFQKTGLELEVPPQYGPIRMITVVGENVIIGTTKNALVQWNLQTNALTPISESHTDELWGVTSHPSQHQFVTCGNDGVLYLWDALTHLNIAVKEFPAGIHCCSFHPSGAVIAVGCVDGRWFIIDAATREIVHSHQDGNDCLNCIAFSPDGAKLAIGSKIGYIVVYSVNDNGLKYHRMGKCQGHTSAVTHFDWSADSQNIQSNSNDYELLFWDATTCQQVRSSVSMRDVQWATQTCTIAFSSAGIWQEGEDGTDINACAKANKVPVIASADDFGKVNLYQYPCCNLKSPRHSYIGHSSHVTNVAFLHDDIRLLSTGGGDMAIFQWEVQQA